VAARGRTAQHGYRLVKATENLLKRMGCPRTFDQNCANKIRRRLIDQGCNARYVWGTHVFAVSNCVVSQDFQPLEPLDFYALTGFMADDIMYVFHGTTSKKPADMLKYGPNQFPQERATFKVFYFSEKTLNMFRGIMRPVTIDGKEALNVGDYYMDLKPTHVSSEESLRRILTRPEPAIVLEDEELESFGELKRRSLQKSKRGYFSTLQVIKRDTLEKILAGSNLAKLYMRTNVLSALVTKSGGVPYRLKILARSYIAIKLAHLLNSGVFIGVALGRPQGSGEYYKAVASIITADLTVKLYYRFLRGPSMEMSPLEIESLADDVVKELSQLATRQSVELVAILRTRRFKQDEGEVLLNRIEKRIEERIFNRVKKKEERPVVLAIGVSKYLPLLAEENEDIEENRDLVWVVEEGEEHGILLYKFRGFKNAVRIEYHASGALEKVEGNIASLAIATYEYTRRLDIMSPYPIKQRMLPAPIKFAKRMLKWIA